MGTVIVCLCTTTHSGYVRVCATDLFVPSRWVGWCRCVVGSGDPPPCRRDCVRPLGSHVSRSPRPPKALLGVRGTRHDPIMRRC